jgi:hypothetical protein
MKQRPLVIDVFLIGCCGVPHAQTECLCSKTGRNETPTTEKIIICLDSLLRRASSFVGQQNDVGNHS